MKQKKSRVIFVSIAAILLLIVLISACNVLGIGGGDDEPNRVAQSKILAPLSGSAAPVLVLRGSSIQIQSAHPDTVTEVGLLEQGPDDQGDVLLQTDIPDDNGVVLQSWTPPTTGLYTLKLAPFVNNDRQTALELKIDVVDSTAVILEKRRMKQTGDGSIDLPTPEASPTASSFEVTSVEPVVVAVASPTPVPHYPPPPPAPGVPPGPTQDQLPEMRPPVADGADLLGVYIPDKTQRILIETEDTVAAKVVGGSTVFRAWRVQNTGTATWGPGYELAFYGGRAMGSGGVVFEQTFPGEPARRNIIVDGNRLIVPKGFPNQLVIPEIMLKAPVTPGIHQSYWRMRNPHGVYFGPIMGVTMNVIRECEPSTSQNRVYGSPTINKFEILGVGNVYQPENPKQVQAEFGEQVTLDWDIINAENFDVVITKPTGSSETVSTSDQRGRVTFTVSELGQYVVTLYADNGSCTASPPLKVFVSVNPPEAEQFRLIIIHAGSSSLATTGDNLMSSSSVLPGDIKAEWNHADKTANQFELSAAIYQEKVNENCLVNSIEWSCINTTEMAPVGEPTSIVVGSDAQGAVTIKNKVRALCRRISDSAVYHEIHYIMSAEKDGRPAKPPRSNLVTDDTNPCANLFPTEINNETLNP